MKKLEITKTVDLMDQLREVAPGFSHQQRMQWAVNNNMSLYTVNRYLKGLGASVIVAEKLLGDIRDLSPALSKGEGEVE